MPAPGALVGDGQTDEAAALQRVIDDAAAGGQSVILPAGRYAVGSSINVPSGLTVVGSDAVVVALPGLGGAPLMVIAGESDVTLTGVSLEGSSSTGALLLAHQSHRITVRDGLLSRSRVAGIRLIGGGEIALSRLRFSEVNRGVFGSPLGETWLDGVSLTDCDFHRMADGAVYFTGSPQAATRRVVLNRCRADQFLAEGTTRSGFYWVSADGERHRDITIVDCTLVGRFSSFVSGDGNSDFMTLYDVDGVQVRGCEVSGGGDIGVSVYRSTNVAISECTIHDNQTVGISFWNATDCSATGNSVHDNRRDFDGALMGIKGGILCRGLTQRVLLSGNHCFATRTPPTQDYGINIESTAREVTLQGNSFSGNASGEVRDEGQLTVLKP